MKKMYGQLFVIVLVCAIISTILVQIDFSKSISDARQRSQESFQEARDLTSKDEVNDMEGYGAIFDWFQGGFNKIAEIIMITISILSIIIVITYITLYLIAWSLFSKSESSKKCTASIMLVSVAVGIKAFYVFAAFQMLSNVFIIIATMSEIISIVFTVIMYIINKDKIKEIYNKKEEIEV